MSTVDGQNTGYAIELNGKGGVYIKSLTDGHIVFDGKIPEITNAMDAIERSPWKKLAQFFEVNTTSVSVARVVLCAVALGITFGAPHGSPIRSQAAVLVASIDIAVVISFITEWVSHLMFKRTIRKYIDSEEVDAALDRIIAIIEGEKKGGEES